MDKRVEDLAVEDVVKWLGAIGSSEFAENFRENKVCGTVLAQLTDEILEKELDIAKKCHRTYILARIMDLKAGKSPLYGDENVQQQPTRIFRQRSMSDLSSVDLGKLQSQPTPPNRRPSPRSDAASPPVSNMKTSISTSGSLMRRGRNSIMLQPISVARQSIDSSDGGMPSAFGNSPLLCRRMSCSDLPFINGPPPQHTPRLAGDSRSVSPDLPGEPSNNNRLTRSDSMSSSHSTRSTSLAPIMQRSASFASQTSSSFSSSSGDLLSFHRLKRFCASSSTLQLTVEHMTLLSKWPVLDFLMGILATHSSLQENNSALEECEEMARQCSNNLRKEGYLLVNDLLQDLDMGDFREDLRAYGLNKKRLLNELYKLLEELRTYLAINVPAASTPMGSNNSMDLNQDYFYSSSSNSNNMLRDSSEELPKAQPLSRPHQRRRSISSGTVESVQSFSNSVHSPPIPPFIDNGHTGWGPVLGAANLQSFASSGSGSHAGKYASPHSDEVSSSTEYSSHASGDESSNHGSPSSLTGSHRSKPPITRDPMAKQRQLPPSTPPNRRTLRQHPYSDQPRAYGPDRSSLRQQQKPKSKKREELARGRIMLLRSQSNDIDADSGPQIVPERTRRKQRQQTAPLPTPPPQTVRFVEDKKISKKSNSDGVKNPSTSIVSEEKVEPYESKRDINAIPQPRRLGIHQRSVSMDFVPLSNSAENNKASSNEATNSATQKYKYKRVANNLVVDVGQNGKEQKTGSPTPPKPSSCSSSGSSIRSSPSCSPDRQTAQQHVQQQKVNYGFLKVDVPTSGGSCGNKSLAVDVHAIESEHDIQQSYQFQSDGALLYGNLVIPAAGGIVGAPGMAALARDAIRDVPAHLKYGAFSAYTKNGKRVKMQSGLRLIGHLGKGAGGTVLKAIHIPSLRIVAIKEVVVNDKSQRKQMRRELDLLLEGVDHPNVVQFYDSFTNPTAGTISMVFEYLQGGSLQDIVDLKRPIPSDRMKLVTYHCFSGLEFLHRKGFIHRDIKPSNLLVSQSGVVKIADFGISRDLENTQAKCNTYLGTCQFMSPERIAGETYGTKADVWSLGLSLFTCALGEFPWRVSGGFWNVRNAILEEPFPPFPADFPSGLEDVIMKCLHRDPDCRASSSNIFNSTFLQSVGAQEESLAKNLEGDNFSMQFRSSSEVSMKAAQELDKVVSKITSYYREMYHASVADAGGESCFTVSLEIVTLRALADQMGLPHHRVIGVIDQALNNLKRELCQP